MNKEEAIKYLQQLYPNGRHCWLDEQRIEAISMAVKALQEEPVSEDLTVELNKYIHDNFTIEKDQLDKFGIEEKDYMYSMDKSDMLAMVKHFIDWQKEQMMTKAIDAHCFGFRGGAVFSFRLPADNYLVGSEVKVIVIKKE